MQFTWCRLQQLRIAREPEMQLMEFLHAESDGQSIVDDDGTGEEMNYIVWVKVAIWINFTISILSLVCLLITFITYVIFQ